MAFAFTVTRKTVFGDERAIHGVLVADGTAGYVATGLSNLYSVNFSPISMTTMIDAGFKINTLDSGTAAAGYLAVTGVTSGDEMYVTVYGV